MLRKKRPDPKPATDNRAGPAGARWVGETLLRWGALGRGRQCPGAGSKLSPGLPGPTSRSLGCHAHLEG